MKIVGILLLFIWICKANGFDFRKICLLYKGRCVDQCPRLMHPYHTRCDKDTISQRTCTNPRVYPIGFTCGWSRCDCNHDLVLEEESGACIELSLCPLSKDKRRRKKGKMIHKRRRKLKLVGDDDYDSNKTYTGHCPMLKFRYGKCYGDNTRQIIREIRSKGLFNKPLEYRPGDNYEIDNMPRRERPSRDIYDGLHNKQPVYMTGYTGYVPGYNFKYGKSYGRVADDCMADFAEHQREIRCKADLNRSYVRSSSAPKMETIHTRDEIRRDLNRFREINKYKGEPTEDNTITPEFPPIAGYTGHIPRIKGSEASLSQRYHCVAKRGLELLRQELDKRKDLQYADKNIKAILKNRDKKFSYWNWG